MDEALGLHMIEHPAAMASLDALAGVHGQDLEVALAGSVPVDKRHGVPADVVLVRHAGGAPLAAIHPDGTVRDVS